jgi:hypothetical protein
MSMEPQHETTTGREFTDIAGLRSCGIFPAGKEPSIRTLREWTKLRRIPHYRVGHFVYYDPNEVAPHIRAKLLIPPRDWAKECKLHEKCLAGYTLQP